MNNVHKQLTEMGAEQSGRRLSIRLGGGRNPPEICANHNGEEWVPTPKFAKLLGRKTPEERQEERKEVVAAARSPAAELVDGVADDDILAGADAVLKTAKQPAAKKKTAAWKKA